MLFYNAHHLPSMSEVRLCIPFVEGGFRILLTPVWLTVDVLRVFFLKLQNIAENNST